MFKRSFQIILSTLNKVLVYYIKILLNRFKNSLNENVWNLHVFSMICHRTCGCLITHFVFVRLDN